MPGLYQGSSLLDARRSILFEVGGVRSPELESRSDQARDPLSTLVICIITAAGILNLVMERMDTFAAAGVRGQTPSRAMSFPRMRSMAVV